MSDIKKYFEIEVERPADWDIERYLQFLLEAMYYTIFPLFIGIVIGRFRRFGYIFLIIIPLFFKLKSSKMKTKKRIYVK